MLRVAVGVFVPIAVSIALLVVLSGVPGAGVALAQPPAEPPTGVPSEAPSDPPPERDPEPDPALEPLPRVGPRLDDPEGHRGEGADDADLLDVPAPDPRRRAPIREILRLECSSELGYRDVVLFSDGVARVKEKLENDEQPTLLLHDFPPDDYQAFVRRLEMDRAPAAGDLTERGPGGAWVEECRLVVTLPGELREEEHFGPFDTLSLALSRRLTIAREIRQAVRAAARLSSLPRGYQARRGDVLERRDGMLFEVLRETGDGGGLEMKGVEQPLTLYIPKGAVRQEFVRLVSRRR